MSLEDSILLLAEAVQELAIAVAASTPPIGVGGGSRSRN